MRILILILIARFIINANCDNCQKLDYTNTDVRKYLDECYDNNNVNGDGCNSITCTIEQYFFCLYSSQEKKDICANLAPDMQLSMNIYFDSRQIFIDFENPMNFQSPLKDLLQVSIYDDSAGKIYQQSENKFSWEIKTIVDGVKYEMNLKYFMELNKFMNLNIKFNNKDIKNIYGVKLDELYQNQNITLSQLYYSSANHQEIIETFKLSINTALIILLVLSVLCFFKDVSRICWHFLNYCDITFQDGIYVILECLNVTNLNFTGNYSEIDFIDHSGYQDINLTYNLHMNDIHTRSITICTFPILLCLISLFIFLTISFLRKYFNHQIMHYADEKLKYCLIYRTFQLVIVRLSFGFSIQLKNLRFETSANAKNSIFGIIGIIMIIILILIQFYQLNSSIINLNNQEIRKKIGTLYNMYKLKAFMNRNFQIYVYVKCFIYTIIIIHYIEVSTILINLAAIQILQITLLLIKYPYVDSKCHLCNLITEIMILTIIFILQGKYTLVFIAFGTFLEIDKSIMYLVAFMMYINILFQFYAIFHHQIEFIHDKLDDKLNALKFKNQNFNVEPDAINKKNFNLELQSQTQQIKKYQRRNNNDNLIKLQSFDSMTKSDNQLLDDEEFQKQEF